MANREPIDPMYSDLLQKVQSIALAAGRNPQDILLLAISKGRSVQDIAQAYAQGCRDFGESRVQEALPKMAALPQDIRWHLVGTLQTNKIKKVEGRFNLIHSIDSLELAQKLTGNVLLQINTSEESTKHGLAIEECRALFPTFLKLPHIHIQGLMTMAPLTQDQATLHHAFRSLRLLRDELVKHHNHPLPHLSMGMSNDYPIAIEEGATILRIGTALFG